MAANITFNILRIKDISFWVNEIFYDPKYPADKVQVRVNCELKFNADANYVIIELNPLYFYEYPDQDIKEHIFANITVHNTFAVNDVKSFIKGDQLYLPTEVLVTLIGISISHTRALFSKNIDGTAFNGIVLPLIDPLEFSKQIFPYMFNELVANNINIVKNSLFLCLVLANKTKKTDKKIATICDLYYL